MVTIDLSTAERDVRAVVGLGGELDVTGAASVTVALADVVACHPDVIIDLTGLEFTDCSGLWVREQTRRAGGGLLLAAPQWLVLRLLAMTGLADSFSVHASVKQAEVAHARNPSA